MDVLPNYELLDQELSEKEQQVVSEVVRGLEAETTAVPHAVFLSLSHVQQLLGEEDVEPALDALRLKLLANVQTTTDENEPTMLAEVHFIENIMIEENTVTFYISPSVVRSLRR